MSVDNFDLGGLGSFGDLATNASDLTSFTDEFGTEFLSDLSIPGVDVGAISPDMLGSEVLTSGSLYDQVGSFAGDATWFDTNYFGSIVDSAGTGISDFGTSISQSTSEFFNLNNGAQILVDDGGYPLLSADVTTINSGIAPSFFDKVADSVSNGVGYVKDQVSETFGINPGGATQILVDDQGIPLLPADVTTINAGIAPTLVDKAVDYGSKFAIQTGQQLAVGVVQQSVGSAASSVLPAPLAGLAARTASQIAGSAVGYNAPGTVGFNGTPISTPGIVDSGQPVANFSEIFNPSTGTWSVFNNTTNQTVATGLTQQAAILSAQDFNVTQGITLNTGPVSQTPTGPAFDSSGNLNPGFILGSNGVPLFTGTGQPTSVTLAEQEAANLQGLTQQLQQQQTIRDQRQNKAQSSDWRVRLRLAPNSNYLYNDPQCGPVLWPLRNTDGVIFPYTPSIDTAYKADYEPYNLTHSNYRGYFYKGSYVDTINIRATFTAQDTSEANYLLGVIHFFRSATKMFYGQDAQRGSPPPLVYLSGLGDYQFNEHPCVISQFNYNLPGDVDYIRAQTSLDNGTNLLIKRDRQYITGNPLTYALQRLATVGLSKGALDPRPPAPTLGIDHPTYVPTKMDITLALFPMQSRAQVSKQFSVKNFANGNLLKGGFW